MNIHTPQGTQEGQQTCIFVLKEQHVSRVIKAPWWCSAGTLREKALSKGDSPWILTGISGWGQQSCDVCCLESIASHILFCGSLRSWEGICVSLFLPSVFWSNWFMGQRMQWKRLESMDCLQWGPRVVLDGRHHVTKSLYIHSPDILASSPARATLLEGKPRARDAEEQT